MNFEVCFLPGEATRRPAPVAVLIDVIRASTTILTLLEAGSPEVVLVSNSDPAALARLRAALGEVLVCAEEPSGIQAAGAELSPSPAALDGLDLGGRRVILATTNGTRAAELLREAGVEHVLIGSLRNATAVMRAAVALAVWLDRSISLVCAGREGCRVPALDDVYCAAALLQRGEGFARAAGAAATLLESAAIARHAARAFAGVREVFEQSRSAAVVRRIGAGADVGYCAAEDVSQLVPVLTFTTGAPAIVVRRLAAG